jgi:phosphoribosylformylglycinamidine cyclo-ligase
MTGSSYADAGVDVEAGEHAVALMRASVERTGRPEVVGGFGGFAGLFDISHYRHMKRPVLATSTDGVGTKIAVARAMDIHHTVGIDLVAMVVDDLVVCGAEPLFLTDYIATGSVDPTRIAAIVSGISEGCVQAGCALVGGETAEHPGLMAADEYDLAAAGTGIVDAEDLLGPQRVRDQDVLIAMASSGLHSNGYSLARHVLLPNGEGLDRHVAELTRTVGEEMLEPTRIYAQDVLALIKATRTHAFSHITGGGIAANIARVLPEDLAAVVDRATWKPPAIFDLIAAEGSIEQGEMEKTFNMGIGMVAILPPESVDEALSLLAARGVPAWVCGVVRLRGSGEAGDAAAKGGSGGAVRVVGDYRTM